jgi:hypothetical protein
MRPGVAAVARNEVRTTAEHPISRPIKTNDIITIIRTSCGAACCHWGCRRQNQSIPDASVGIDRSNLSLRKS